MRRTTWASVLAVLVFAAGWATAVGEDDEAAKGLEKRAKDAIARYKKNSRTKDLDRRCEAVFDLSRTQHALTAAELGTVLMKDRTVDVREACAMVLGDMTEVPEAAGTALKDVVALCVKKRRDESPEVLKSIATSIGKLKFAGAHDELLWMLDHEDQWVVVAALRAIGDVGDLKALPKLYDLAAYQGTGYSWSTGEVSVDTGASGDTDQKAAEAAWKAKYGHVRARAAGPTVVKLYMRHLRETVEKLTGEKFKNLASFKQWLNEHEVEVGLKPPPRKPAR